MQTVSLGDSLHEMSNPILLYLKKKKKKERIYHQFVLMRCINYIPVYREIGKMFIIGTFNMEHAELLQRYHTNHNMKMYLIICVPSLNVKANFQLQIFFFLNLLIYSKDGIS